VEAGYVEVVEDEVIAVACRRAVLRRVGPGQTLDMKTGIRTEMLIGFRLRAWLRNFIEGADDKADEAGNEEKRMVSGNQLRLTAQTRSRLEPSQREQLCLRERHLKNDMSLNDDS